MLSLTSLSAFAATPTAAVTGTANVTIGTLNVTTKATTFTVTDMILVDARGTGAGWSVNIEATHFTNATATNATLKTLQNGSLVLGTVSIVAGADSTPVTNIAIGAETIDVAGGVKILNAPINEGMGTYTVRIAPMTLTLPKQATAGTYTATTITLTLSQGPVT